MSLPPQHRLNRYTIDKVLGKGGFGVTYRAWDPKYRCYVAIKENYPAYLVQRTANHAVQVKGSQNEYEWTIKHFRQEAQLLLKLRHESIVRGIEEFTENNTCYFVMELLNAKPLSVMKGAAFWPEKRLRPMLEKLLDAFRHMHSRNVYHRDIKPANIMVRANGTPVIIDFGAAKHTSYIGDSETRSFVSKGYTALEQMADPNHLAPGIDIYSLGATIYCLLTGSPPPNAATRKINDPCIPAASHPELAGRYSPALLHSIDRALAVDASVRYGSADEWLSDLQGNGSSFRPSRPEPAAAPDSSPTLPFISTNPASSAVRSSSPSAASRRGSQSAAASRSSSSSRSASRSAPPSRPSQRAKAVSTGDDIIPVTTIVRYAANTCYIISGLLFLGMLISLVSNTSGGSSLDAFFPLVVGLVLLGWILKLLLRMNVFKD